MKPRLLFIDQSGLLGGAELCLLDIATHYREQSEVLLLGEGPFLDRLEQSGVQASVLRVPARLHQVRRETGAAGSSGAVWAALSLAREVARRARAFDLLYANTQKAFVVASLAGKLAAKPVLFHLRDILSPEHFSRSNRRLVTALANRLAARVVANSRASAEAFRQAGGRKQVEVVYDGIDEQALALPRPGDGSLREQMGLSGLPLVGVFSRLAPWKGQHVLLEALAQLPGVHAWCVGEALFGEEDYASSLRARTEQPDLEGRVHFLDFRSDAAALMAQVDAVLHTSTVAEPFGRVIVEGMMAARPVIATAGGGALEILEDGRSGLLVPMGDPGALSSAIRSLYRDPAWAGELASAGQRRAKEHFSLEVTLPSLQREIAAALQGGPRRGLVL